MTRRTSVPLLLAVAGLLSGARVSAAAVSVADPRCEGLREAPQVDTTAPRFSWRLVADERDVVQTAYQLRVTEVDARGRPLGTPLESARLESDETQWVVLPGFAAKARATYAWQVRAWDNHGNASEWTEPRRFGTGLLGERWPADWIGDGRVVPLFETAPARHFRGTFRLEHLPVRARLYVSALGLVEPWLNGEEVTEDRFVPGWPDYRRRVFYAAFDVAHLLRQGDNTLGMVLGDGWYSGTMIPRHQYGPQAMLSSFLDLTDAQGRVTTLTTGEGWRWTDAGPITSNSIYHGEAYDARRELAGWSDPRPSADGEGWRPVTVRAGRHTPAAFTARLSPPVRRIETLEPVAVHRRGPDVHVYDLGQNVTGWARLRVEAEAGREIRLRFAEMLEPNGGLHTANLRSARATALYVAKGEGVEEWEPRFTYFGFRYVELSGVERPPEDAIRGVVLQTDLPRTGEFESSSPLLNRLWRNTLWSQRGNFLELPTDCPQRDERAGWSGDAQVFAPTALYNMDAGPFFRQWLFSLRDGLRDDPRGGYPDVAPHTGFGHGSPGWGEAGVIVPWTVWLHTGDRRVLAENLPAIQHALELMAAQSPDGIRLVPASWGDWLAPGFPRYKSPPRQDLIATAYYAHAADLAARIADALGRPELAASNRALRDRARAAYQRAFIAPDGRVADDVQTSYLLTLAFDLAPPAQRERIVGHLVRTLAEKGDHLATGFLGTPLILPVLTDVGRPDLGYTVLQQTTYPGWLLSVVNGATTIWERWDSWTPERGFHEEGMNSFNHYAYGSVVSWFYDTIAGLRPLPEAPGWKRFRIAPQPGGGLTHAAARIQTPHGEASSTWRIEDGRLRLLVGIPPNTRAEVVLPARDAAAVLLDGAPLARHALAEVHPDGEGRPVVALPSGRYEFLLPAGDEGPPAGPGGSAGGAPGGSGPAALRWGEHVLRQPAGWYASREATALADSVLRYQSPPGGWPKNTDLAADPGSPADVPAPGDGRANTIDNGATTLPMRFLALVAHATGEARYREAFARGVDYLLEAQYENGGWPQFFPLREGYYSHITYNDGAMVSVLSLLRDAAGGRPPYSFVDAERRARAAAAVARGLDCILRTQIRQGGRLTAWCAQHDEKTLEPAWARAYEPPSLSGAESVGIVRFLMSLEDPSSEVVAAVEGAVAWFRAMKITGQRLERTRRDDGRTERHLVPDPAAPPLWARFYELGTNRPLYLDRDSVFRYDFAQIGYERRSGYNYHGTWPAELLAEEYPRWRARLRAEPGAGADSPTWARGIEGQRKADLGNGFYLNPIVSGDHPDPSILKDGDDYHMTFSSFDAYPGLVIWHSRDLVNWRPIGPALFKNVGSVWAPDLVKHAGRYFIYFPGIGPYRSTYVIWADDIRGPWSAPIDLKNPRIDPGHAVGPDGRRYLFLSAGYLVPLSEDGLSIVGPEKKIYDGWRYPEDWIVETFAQEGPKILRKDGYYYQVLAQGGTAGPPTGHMVVAARSRTIEGPWENSPYNPIVRTRSPSERWWSKGHATLVEGPDERWWMVYHAYENGFYNLGRQTLLQPIDWLEDGWFRATNDSDRPIPKPVPDSEGEHGFAFSDDFSSDKTGVQWSFYKGTEADRSRYRHEDRSLVLKAKGTSPSDSSPLWFVTGDHAYEFQVEVDADPDAVAGVLLFYNQRLYVGLGLSDENLIVHNYGAERRAAKPSHVGRRLHFRLRNDRHIVTIHYSADGETWERFDRAMEVSGYHHNVGYDFLSLRPALYAAGTGEARFRRFQYRALP